MKSKSVSLPKLWKRHVSSAKKQLIQRRRVQTRQSPHPNQNARASTFRKHKKTPVSNIKATKKKIMQSKPKPKYVRNVSLIIPAMNTATSLQRTLTNLKQWQRVKEIIVVANGCSDATANIARRFGAKVCEFPFPIGHDTGRAVGAEVATGKHLVFLDGDIVWSIPEVRPFVQALDRGIDIALNRYPLPGSRFYHHQTAVAKRALNLICQRPFLRAASLTAIPNAISQKALQVIGSDSLAIPPLAQAKACVHGLHISACSHVHVGKKNPWNREQSRAVRDLILGDHLEAIAYLIQQRGARAGFEDRTRHRDILKNTKPMEEPGLFQHLFSRTEMPPVRAVIPAYNEAATLPQVIQSVQGANISQVCVVDNGSTDKTAEYAKQQGAEVLLYQDRLGHDIGRALGGYSSPSACTVFVDADFPIPPAQLAVFVEQVQNNGADVALNNLQMGLPPNRRVDAVSTLKAFLNIAIGRPDLGVNSLTAVPHALSLKALCRLHPEDVAVPPKAQVRAVLEGLTLMPATYVDVVKPNRFRPQAHASRFGSPLKQLIIGDHVEAMGLWIQKRGIRGGFPQTRRLDVLHRR